ncbi:response regulator transcription factor [Paraburkholderia sacchari]|uniref:response regulator transcription factor n=1 Tax=Paraburkholderia sacchari TaxID=159450 RepID=UPI003D97CE72
MRIAVLDANPIQTDFVCRTLSAAGHACHTFSEVGELTMALRRETFDLLVLEWNVARVAGDHVRQLAQQSLSACLPVLFMTNRSNESSVAALLNNGVGDYIVKPVSDGVLAACVGSLLRRACQSRSAALVRTFGAYKFDLKLRRTLVGGRSVALTQKEFDLALLLFQHLSLPLSRAHIRDVIWKHSNYVPSRTMDTHMSILRSKLGLRPENGYRLIPIYGYGYRLDQVDESDA